MKTETMRKTALLGLCIFSVLSCSHGEGPAALPGLTVPGQIVRTPQGYTSIETVGYEVMAVSSMRPGGYGTELEWSPLPLTGWTTGPTRQVFVVTAGVIRVAVWSEQSFLMADQTMKNVRCLRVDDFVVRSDGAHLPVRAIERAGWSTQNLMRTGAPEGILGHLLDINRIVIGDATIPTPTSCSN